MNLESTKIRTRALVTVLTLLAAAVRLPTLGESIAGDESTTFFLHSESSWTELLLTYTGPNQHSLFSALSNLSLAVFGESEWAFRLPSLLAGVLAIPLAYGVGRRLTRSHFSGVAAAFLLVFSWPHLAWSQQARGYALTAFLALLLVFCVWQWLAERHRLLWGAGVVVSGWALVWTLPSNVYFSGAVGAAFLATLAGRGANSSPRSFPAFLPSLAPFLILALVTAAYFLGIYPDLQRGLESYRIFARMQEGYDTLGLTPDRLFLVLQHLVAPWGPGLYFLVLYGWLALNPRARLQLAIYYVLPLVLVWVSGVLGPPRAYIYWVPFILIPAAHGGVRAFQRVAQTAGKTTSAVLGVCAVGGLALVSILNLPEHYAERLQRDTATLAEARQVLHRIRETSSPHELVVFPFQDRVLRRYIEDEVAHRMFRIFQDRRLDAVTLIAHRAVPPETIPQVGINPTPALKPRSFQRVDEIGALRVYRLAKTPVRFWPPPQEVETDYELALISQPDERVGLEKVEAPRILGQAALRFQKKVPEDVYVRSPAVKMFELASDDNYLLLVYAKRYLQKSSLSWSVYRGTIPRNGLLNFLFGVFRPAPDGWTRYPVHPYHNFNIPGEKPWESEADIFWQLIFSIYPLDRGGYGVAESFWLQEAVSHFDGVQSFVLVSPDRPAESP